ncbi:MAG: AMP-binding protein, partial [Actinomycetota bacterium]|nr:AMP-binding protein [Actinomycetota bacterium]
MPRPLEPLAPPTRDAEVDHALRRVAAALDGSGPALVPVPPDRRGRAVIAMARPDTPLEVGPSGEDVAMVVPTSGSTGDVKGALLTSSALRHSAAAALRGLGGPGQWLLALPTTSVGGISVLVRSIVSGTRPELLEPDDRFTFAGFVAATQRLTGPRRYA